MSHPTAEGCRYPFVQSPINYITAITKPQIKTLIKEGVIQLSLFDDKIMEVMDNGTRYVLRRNPVRALEIAKSREKKYKFLQDFVTEQNDTWR